MSKSIFADPNVYMVLYKMLATLPKIAKNLSAKIFKFGFWILIYITKIYENFFIIAFFHFNPWTSRILSRVYVRALKAQILCNFSASKKPKLVNYKCTRYSHVTDLQLKSSLLYGFLFIPLSSRRRSKNSLFWKVISLRTNFKGSLLPFQLW